MSFQNFWFVCTVITTALVSYLSSSAVNGEEPPKTNQTSTTSVRNQTLFVRSPPTKSLYTDGQLFRDTNNNAGALKTLAAYPLRESYIAFEQAHPINHQSSLASFGPNYEDYFKPSKFQPSNIGIGSGGGGFDTSDYYTTKLQNNYPPPPPPPPSLQFNHHQSQPNNYGHFSQHEDPLYLPLPPPPPPPPFLRLVKIPGDLKITVRNIIGGSSDLEILCEFPGYLLIAQEIYWHFIPPPSSLLLPYGTFYDSRNGFAPRVTVTKLSKWRSVLKIRDYSPDDYGTYRCVSTAILPDEPSHPMNPPSRYPYQQSYPQYPTRSPLSHTSPISPPTSSYLLHFPHGSFTELRNSASTIVSDLQQKREIDGANDKAENDSSTVNQGRKIKFTRRKRREIGVFGVYAPFFKPHYGIYRIFKEVQFPGDPFGAGSEIENMITAPEEPEDQAEKPNSSSGIGGKGKVGGKGTLSSEEKSKSIRNGRRKFDYGFTRKSKVLF